jgi:hypothetical protein
MGNRAVGFKGIFTEKEQFEVASKRQMVEKYIDKWFHASRDLGIRGNHTQTGLEG